jgi:ribosomal protein L20A (L18A)
MSSVQTFRIKGNYIKKSQKVSFTQDVRATKEKDAIEQVYTVIGSNGVLRRKINFESINVIPSNESKSVVNNQIEKFVNGE